MNEITTWKEKENTAKKNEKCDQSASRKVLVVDTSNERERWSRSIGDLRENFVNLIIVILLFNESRFDENCMSFFSQTDELETIVSDRFLDSKYYVRENVTEATQRRIKNDDKRASKQRWRLETVLSW